MKNKRAALVEALTGRLTPHHRRMLQLHLDVITSLEAAVAEIDRQLGEALAPFRDATRRVDGVPGIDIVTAQAVVGEIGLDMARFPTHHHLLSWACLCPRLDQSAGKRKSTRTRPGASWAWRLVAQDRPRPSRLGRRGQEGE